MASVNRPPTPDPVDAAQPTLQESIHAKLVQSGEKDRLRALLHERLVECGWRDELKARCRAILKKKGLSNVTVDELTRDITPLGRASVPDTIKAELLREIRDFLQGAKALLCPQPLNGAAPSMEAHSSNDDDAGPELTVETATGLELEAVATAEAAAAPAPARPTSPTIPASLRLGMADLAVGARPRHGPTAAVGGGGSAAAPPLSSTDSLAHVYLHQLQAHFDPTDVVNVSIDDSNHLVLVAERSVLTCWPIKASTGGPLHPKVCLITEGPILATRFSLDGALLAIQRTSRDVEFVHQQKGTVFWQVRKDPNPYTHHTPSVDTQRCRRAEPLLGFFWVNTPECDLVLVTGAGLELYQLLPEKSGLRLVDTKDHKVDWYRFTHETRLILIATEVPGSMRMSGYQFVTSGILRLPKFDLAQQGAERKRVERKNVHLIMMYGCMYCAHVDYNSQQLRLHRFYRDALIHQHTFPLYSAQVSLSVVDNALLVHNTDSGVVLVHDVMAPEPHPLASPLPPRVPPHISPIAGAPQPDSTTSPAEVYSAHWDFCTPDLIVDWQYGLVWRQRLDLAALVASCSDGPTLVGFLQRRCQDLPYPSPSHAPRQLSLSVTKAMILDHMPLGTIAQVFELLCTAFKEALNSGHSLKGHTNTNANSTLLPRSPALNPEEMVKGVFVPLEEEMAGDHQFLVATATEYLRCCDTLALPCPASLPILLLSLLQHEDRLHELPAWVPVLSRPPGKQIALEVAEAAKAHPPAMQVVQDLLHRPSTHEVYVSILLEEGRVLDALRYARKNGVESIPPISFLDAALRTCDPCMFATVYRFCYEFVPAFTSMPSYARYTAHLHELCGVPPPTGKAPMSVS